MTNETVNPSGSESYLAKLSIKTMGCDPRKVATVESGKLPLARIYGKAVDVKFTGRNRWKNLLLFHWNL